MWCEGEVVSVANGESDKRSERARTLLPAGALRLKWPEDVEREEPESFTWTILHPQKLESRRAVRMALGAVQA
eukprot:4852092-Pleurochrysis_carterae.AAC.1